jgi:hypothetical protein
LTGPQRRQRHTQAAQQHRFIWPALSLKEIGSYERAQELLRQGHRYLDSNGDGEACESLRR